MSSCLSGSGRTYGFDLDIVKSPSPSARSSHSSSPSSTLSESSNSPLAISTKRARTPRKRPNQSYTEAAAALSTIYPNLFSTKNLHRLYKHSKPFFSSFTDSSSDLLPPFPALADAGFLIREPSTDKKPTFRFESKPTNQIENSLNSSLFEPTPGPIDEDFDAESILDEEVEEGIDSIMGNLSMNNNNGDSSDYNSHINPYFGSLMGFGFGGKFELGFGFRLGGNIRQALRRADDGDWWRSQTVAVRDIVPKFKASPPSSEKKKKKKKKVEEEEEVKDSQAITTATTASSKGELKAGLGLKLNYEEVLKAWSDGGSPFNSDGPGTPESSSHLIVRI